MKRYIIVMTLLAMLGSVFAKKPVQPIVNRIEPANWFVEMKNTQLQIMLYGKGIREANVTTNYQGARIMETVKLDSPNYLLVYVELKDAEAGIMPLTVTLGKRIETIKYELKKREMAGADRYGFTNADVLYMLMPDRFSRSGDDKDVEMKTQYKVDRNAPSLRHGGNLAGLREHLDYFNKLGVTALWFTPVLENDSPDNGGNSTYHGYATTDYYRIDPRFGSNEEYRQLIDDAHKHGLKIIMDMIFNHCGFEHPWVADRPSKDWFNTPEWLDAPKKAPAHVEGQSTTYAGGVNDLYVQTSYKLTPTVDPYASKIDKKETVDGWFVPSMPDLNQRNKHVMRYLIQNSKWWIETVGIDGIRMDTYPYADYDGMASWMKEINEEYPNYNVVGESWVTEPAFTAALQKDCKFTEKNSYLNTVMDFTFFERINQAAKWEETDGWWNGYNKVYNGLVYDYLYANPSNVLAFLDNHDTDRFLNEKQDPVALKQALSVLMTMNRIPQLYYGTEIMMTGNKSITDGYVRNDFPGGFKGDSKNAFTGAGMTEAETEMFDWTARLLHWRKGNEVISKGQQIQFIPYNGIYVLARQYNGKTVMTIVNGLNTENTVGMKRYEELFGSLTTATDVMTGTSVSLTEDLSLSARQSIILEF